MEEASVKPHQNTNSQTAAAGTLQSAQPADRASHLRPRRVQPVPCPHAPLVEGDVDVAQVCVAEAAPLQILHSQEGYQQAMASDWI